MLGDDGTVILSEGLKMNSTLTELNLACDESQRMLNVIKVILIAV